MLNAQPNICALEEILYHRLKIKLEYIICQYVTKKLQKDIPYFSPTDLSGIIREALEIV